MVNAREGHEIPEERPDDEIPKKSEGNPTVHGTEEGVRERIDANMNLPTGFAEYQKKGGTLTPAEYKLVLDTPATGKGGYRQRAEEAGISIQTHQIIAVSMMLALKGDPRLESDSWLRSEANALVPAYDLETTEAVAPTISDTKETKLAVPMGFEKYQQAGGEMSAEDFAKVRRFALVPNFIAAAMQAGEAGASLAWKGKMIGVFGKDDAKLNDQKWFKKQVDALMATQDVWAVDPNDVEDPRNKKGFDAYQHINGSLSSEEFSKVVSIKMPTSRSKAKVLPKLMQFRGMADMDKVNWAARIAEALPHDERVNNAEWLVNETNRFWAIQNVLK